MTKKKLLTTIGSLVGLLTLAGLAITLALTLSQQTPSPEPTATLAAGQPATPTPAGETFDSPLPTPTEARKAPSPTATATPGAIFDSPVETPTPEPLFWAEKIRVEREFPVKDSPVSFVVGIAWSPDGQKLAFVKPGGIWVVDADGTSLQLVGKNGYLPTWSPDGSTLAYVSYDGKEQYGLQTVDMESKAIEQLRTTSSPTKISWLSKDQVVFVDESRLKRSDKEGKSVTQISNYEVRQVGPIGFIPSPDGDYIAWDDHGVLKVIALDTEQAVTLDRFLSVLGGFSWLPDSQTLVYGKTDNGYAIWLAKAEGQSKPRLVSSTISQPYSLSTSPDGHVIAFVGFSEVMEREAIPGVMAINVDGTGLNLLIKNANAAVWSPDGSRIAFEREGYLWIATLSF